MDICRASSRDTVILGHARTFMSVTLAAPEIGDSMASFNNLYFRPRIIATDGLNTPISKQPRNRGR